MFVSLHTHSSGSVLDGVAKPEALIERAVELGMPSLGLTDHGVMYHIPRFYQAALKAGVHPVLGVEAYIVDQGKLTDRKRRQDQEPCHLILLAKDNTGYQNLCRLTTIAHTDGFYYKPRLDHETLAAHSDGLIVTSACIGGDIPTLLLKHSKEEAQERVRWYHDTFGDRFYLEVQCHGLPEEQVYTPFAIEMSRQLGVPLLAACDAHFARPGDDAIQDLLLCIGTGKRLRDEQRMHGNPDLYLPTERDIVERLSQVMERKLAQAAVARTEEVAARCQATLTFGGIHLPEPAVPAGHSSDSYLALLCEQAMAQRAIVGVDYRERLAYELRVITETGFAPYILLVEEIVAEARRQRIPYQARGSAGGSLVCWLLGITHMDPIQWGLVFERFLNPERVAMPDIDMDFADNKRTKMLEWTRERFGVDRVAQLHVFTNIKARQAVRDIGRVTQADFALIEAVARRIPEEPGMTLAKAFAGQELTEEEEALVEHAKLIEDHERAESSHAAGVIIAPCPLTDIAPLMWVSTTEKAAGGLKVQYDMHAVEDLGYLKMDFLGLSNLTIVDGCLQLLAQAGSAFRIEDIPLDDDHTYEQLRQGHCAVLFQLESDGFRRAVVDLGPRSVADLAALVALYRPGPIDNIGSYCKRARREEPVISIHPSLDAVLAETYGIPVYQEQVMAIGEIVAGYTKARADLLRKTIGKKIIEKIKIEETDFTAAALGRGYSKAEVAYIWSFIQPFARYGFNRAHAFAYGLLAYQTAYLRTHFPAQYLCAALTAAGGNHAKIQVSIAEARRLNVPLLPPDINRSQADFTLEDGAIRWGLTGIKGIGEAMAAQIAGQQPYQSLQEVMERCRVNKTVLMALKEAGACAVLGISRKQMDILMQRKLRPGQLSLLSAEEDALPATEDDSLAEIRAMEINSLGVALSLLPFAQLRSRVGVPGRLLELEGEGRAVANVLSCMRTMSRKGQEMLVGALEDDSGEYKFFAFGQVEALQAMLESGAVMLLDLQKKGDVVFIRQARPLPTHATVTTVRIDRSVPGAFARLQQLLHRATPGHLPLTLAVDAARLELAVDQAALAALRQVPGTIWD
jgi:DNA polymerase-3 subunit alpha